MYGLFPPELSSQNVVPNLILFLIWAQGVATAKDNLVHCSGRCETFFHHGSTYTINGCMAATLRMPRSMWIQHKALACYLTQPTNKHTQGDEEPPLTNFVFFSFFFLSYRKGRRWRRCVKMWVEYWLLWKQTVLQSLLDLQKQGPPTWPRGTMMYNKNSYLYIKTLPIIIERNYIM